MFNKIKKLLEFWSKTGAYLPAAHDNRTGKGSASLLFAHVANFVVIVGLCLALYKDLKLGVVSAIIYSVLMISFYLLRSLNKVKIDANDGEIELDSGESVKVETSTETIITKEEK